MQRPTTEAVGGAMLTAMIEKRPYSIVGKKTPDGGRIIQCGLVRIEVCADTEAEINAVISLFDPA
jgi:hypothetical protein